MASLAALVALVGLGDAIYLTVYHYNGKQVQCTIVSGCEEVLNSSYSEIAGIPLAVFGALAYFTAFSLATLAAFDYRHLWKLFSLQALLMALFSGWLLYVQAYIIQHFCQYCLLSAAVSFTLFTLVIVSYFFPKKLE